MTLKETHFQIRCGTTLQRIAILLHGLEIFFIGIAERVKVIPKGGRRGRKGGRRVTQAGRREAQGVGEAGNEGQARVGEAQGAGRRRRMWRGHRKSCEEAPEGKRGRLRQGAEPRSSTGGAGAGAGRESPRTEEGFIAGRAAGRKQWAAEAEEEHRKGGVCGSVYGPGAEKVSAGQPRWGKSAGEGAATPERRCDGEPKRRSGSAAWKKAAA